MTNRGRRLTKPEIMRPQGFDPASVNVVVSQAVLGKQIGKSLSVNVLERILRTLLPATGLAKGNLPVRWADGTALRRKMDKHDYFHGVTGTAYPVEAEDEETEHTTTMDANTSTSRRRGRSEAASTAHDEEITIDCEEMKFLCDRAPCS